MKKIIFKKAIDILRMLDEKQIENLWKKYTKNLKIVYSDKEEKLDYLSLLMLENNLEKLLFCDDEMMDFFEILEFEIVNENIPKFVKENYIFEINSNYYIPLEYKDPSYTMDYDDTDDLSETLTQYYLFINGAIEVKKLVSLINQSGINISKKDVLNICKNNEFKIKNNIIYLNDFVFYLNDKNNLINLKNKKDYYVVDIDYVYDEFASLLEASELKKVDKYLKEIKNKNKLEDIKSDLFLMMLYGDNLSMAIDNYFKFEKIKIGDNDLNELREYLCKLANEIPCWTLNGYSKDETDYEISVEDLDKIRIGDDDFDELSQYIYDYVIINGVIHVDKIYDLILNVHKINTSKKEIDKRINNLANNENILKLDNYLGIMGGTKIAFQEFYKNKHIQDYKIINDFQSVEWGNLELHLQVEQLCDKYKFNDRLEQIILFVTQIDVFSKEKFEEILSTEKIIIPQSIKNKVIPEIKKINKDARLWAYNGFTIEEVKNKKIPLK